MKQTQQLFFIECFNEHVPKDAETEIHPTYVSRKNSGSHTKVYTFFERDKNGRMAAFKVKLTTHKPSLGLDVLPSIMHINYTGFVP